MRFGTTGVISNAAAASPVWPLPIIIYMTVLLACCCCCAAAFCVNTHPALLPPLPQPQQQPLVMVTMTAATVTKRQLSLRRHPYSSRFIFDPTFTATNTLGNTDTTKSIITTAPRYYPGFPCSSSLRTAKNNDHDDASTNNSDDNNDNDNIPTSKNDDGGRSESSSSSSSPSTNNTDDDITPVNDNEKKTFSTSRVGGRVPNFSSSNNNTKKWSWSKLSPLPGGPLVPLLLVGLLIWNLLFGGGRGTNSNGDYYYYSYSRTVIENSRSVDGRRIETSRQESRSVRSNLPGFADNNKSNNNGRRSSASGGGVGVVERLLQE